MSEYLYVSVLNPSIGGAGGGVVNNYYSTIVQGGTTSFVVQSTVNYNTTVLSGGTVLGGPSIVAAGGTITSGDASFADSNGISFGIAGSVITGSVKTDYLTTAANSTHTHSQYLTADVGGAAISAGSTAFSSGTVAFLNSNGVTFGMDSTGGITATVEPGAAAGIAAIGASGGSATSGTVAFGNGNGVSFGYSAGTVTGSVATNYLTTAANSTHTHSQYLTTAANSTHSHSQYLTTAANSTHTHAYLSAGMGISAFGGSQSTGTVVFSNSNGLSFGYNAGTITGSFLVSDMTVANLTLLQGTGASVTNVTIQGPALYAGAGIAFSTSGNSITVYTV